jgi:hypothetical protein
MRTKWMKPTVGFSLGLARPSLGDNGVEADSVP